MKIAVIGCNGRMGRAIVKAIQTRADCTLSGGAVRPGNNAAGQDIGILCGIDPLHVYASSNLEYIIAEADAVIDFTQPPTSLAVAKHCSGQNTAHICGTTGFNAEQFTELQSYTHSIPIVWSANMSIGVNILCRLVKQTAGILDADHYDVEIMEMHHRNKVDAPSGTALALGRAVASGREVNFDSVATLSRQGITGSRKTGEIGFAALRGGDIIGEHTVLFAGTHERIEFTHKATDRSLFAQGAVRACLWVQHKPAGFYSMEDVLFGL